MTKKRKDIIKIKTNIIVVRIILVLTMCRFYRELCCCCCSCLTYLTFGIAYHSEYMVPEESKLWFSVHFVSVQNRKRCCSY